MFELPKSISANEVSAAFDKIIIQRHLPDKTEGGIILTDLAKHYMADQIGIIASKGPSADDSLKIGDVVVFAKHSGDWVTLPGSKDQVFFALDIDVLAIVHKG